MRQGSIFPGTPGSRISTVVRYSLTAVVFMVAAVAGQKSAATRSIIDMAGRKVTIPVEIHSVYSISPMGDVVMYVLAPDKAAGTTYTASPEEKRYQLDSYNKLPVLGGWFGKNTTGNPEVIIKAHPDIILSMGYLDKTDLSSAERIQAQLGIPVVMVDGRLTKCDTSFRFIGGIINESKRADILARYCRTTLDTVASALSNIPQEEKVKVYYSEGPNGLETDPKGSMHTEVLDMVEGINVADMPEVRGYGRGSVSMEQLLVWQPDLILVCLDRGYGTTGTYGLIMRSDSWKNMKAVQNKRVYEIPSLPHNWFDRPPSISRIIGLRWLANLLYPDRFKIDIRAQTLEFYALFYHKKLTPAELDEVLEHAVAK